MRKTTFRFPSADKITTIHGVIWQPENEVKCVLQISHGITEYIDRYEPLAEYLTNAGIAVVGIVLLGHGKSIYEASRKAYFGPEGSWHWVVEDVHLCKEIAKEQFEGLPYFMMGFSLGSFLVRTYMTTYAHENDISGYILMGTGQQPAIILKVIRSLVRNEGKKITDNNTSDFIKSLSFGNYNKAFKPTETECDWLCANKENLEKYIQDARCYKDISAGLFCELLTGMIFTGDFKNITKVQKDVPVYFISGREDPVGDAGKGVKAAYNSFQKAGVKFVEITFYEHARHDILHEYCKDDVYRTIEKWILKRIS